MKIKRFTALLLAVLLVISLTACSGEKVYRATSDKLYYYDLCLDGPSEIDPDNCYIVVKGSHIEYHHYSYIFTGDFDGRFVYWDNDPELLAGGTYKYTEIGGIEGGGYTLTIYYDYPMDDGASAYIHNKIHFK